MLGTYAFGFDSLLGCGLASKAYTGPMSARFASLNDLRSFNSAT
jgi:hypothetical protein